jgi:hypothetical protein
MADTGKGKSLLESLRAKSEALRANEGAARRPVEEAQKEIDRRLMRAFRWLDEALGHLEVIRPVVSHQFTLANLLEISDPHIERCFVTFRRRTLASLEVIDHVELFYRLIGDQQIVLRMKQAAANAVEERLRVATLPYQHDTDHDEGQGAGPRGAVFRVRPEISASVRFQPDYQRQIIEVTLRNVDRFESVSLEFGPDKVDEQALEDLVRLMTGESNAFLHRAPLAGVLSRRPELPVSQPPSPKSRAALRA